MTVFDQSFFQVRLDWGVEGLARLAPCDIVVVVDVLMFTSDVADAVAAGRTVALRGSRSVNGAPLAARAAASAPLVLAGSLRNATAVARDIAARQRRGGRMTVAVLPAGEHTRGGGLRFAVEDQLGAGAIVAALGDAGSDHTSPEAAVAAESFRALHGAVRHMLAACGGGQELIAAGMRDAVGRAAEIDAVDAVPVLRDGVFRAA